MRRRAPARTLHAQRPRLGRARSPWCLGRFPLRARATRAGVRVHAQTTHTHNSETEVLNIWTCLHTSRDKGQTPHASGGLSTDTRTEARRARSATSRVALWKTEDFVVFMNSANLYPP